MIAGISKAITLYLAPVLALTSIFLSLFAYLAPVLLLHDRVSLLTVTPSSTLVQAGPARQVDGPSLFLGALGSCSRPKSDAGINCTVVTINPVYDLSALPSNAPTLALTAPTAATPAFIAIALSLTFIFFFSFTLISFRHKMPARIGAMLEKPAVQSSSAWIGFGGFMIGITSFLVLRMWFGKAIDDFNNGIIQIGKGAPELVANPGNAFTMVWVAYAFHAVPLIISMAKLNVTSTKA